MLYYFYLTRNIIGLVLIISPLAGFLYIDSNFIFSMITICTASVIVPLILRRQLYSTDKTLLMASVWTGTMVFGAFFSVLMERNTYTAFTAAVISVFAGLFVFLDRQSVNVKITRSPVGRRRTKSSLKAAFFCGILGFAGASAYIAMPETVVVDFFLAPEAVLSAGLLAGSAAAAVISHNKSIYGGCIYMILLAVISATCASFAGSSAFLCYLGQLCSGLFMSGILATIPLLTFYLSDPASFSGMVITSSLAACTGLASAFLISRTGSMPVVFANILLIPAFLMLFSAWKHRFFLLKSTGI